METNIKRLKRSDHNRVFAGVCGGLAEYFGVDVVVVRVAYVALTILSKGLGILLYLFAWFIMPLDKSTEGEQAAAVRHVHGATKRFFGMFLVVAGALALVGFFIPGFFHWFSFWLLLPLLIIALGAALLIRTHDHEHRDAQAFPDAEAAPLTPNAPPHEVRRLMRLHQGRKIAGVCAGIADYLDVDPTLVRLVWIILLLCGGLGFLLYLILWIAMPLREERATS